MGIVKCTNCHAKLYSEEIECRSCGAEIVIDVIEQYKTLGFCWPWECRPIYSWMFWLARIDSDLEENKMYNRRGRVWIRWYIRFFGVEIIR